MNSLRNNFLILLIYLIFFQDYVGLLIFNASNSNLLVKIFLSMKDFIIFFVIFLNFARTKYFGLNVSLVYLGLYSVVVLLYFMFFPSQSFNDLRSLLFPFYCMTAGYLCTNVNIEKIIQHLRLAVFLSTVIALGLYSFGPDLLKQLNVLEYTEQGRGYSGITTDGLPSAFFNFFGDRVFFRLAAGILNPVATAELIAFSLAILLSVEITLKIKTSWWIYATLMTAIVLTFSRGPILGGLIALIFTAFLWRNESSIFVSKKLKRVFGVFFIAVTFFGIELIIKIFTSTINLSDPSSRDHFFALVDSWAFIKNNWMGSGIGAFGEWEKTATTAGGENSYVMIVGQVGVVGIALLFVSYFFIIRTLLVNKNNFLSLGLFFSFVLTLINSFFSPSLLSVSPLMLFWFLVGYFERSISTQTPLTTAKVRVKPL